MRAYRIYSGRREHALERIERASTPLGPDDVRLSVGAVSLNYRDLMIARGDYPVSSDDPPIAVADGAGEVIAVGSAVSRFRMSGRTR